MKLNLLKSTTGIGSKKISGFRVYWRGIDVNSKEVTAILDMKPPETKLRCNG